MSRTSSPAAQAVGAQRAASGALPVGRFTPFKEAVGPANDAFEREADRIAQAVTQGGQRPVLSAGWSAASAPTDTIQRQCAKCDEEEDETIPRAPKEAGEAPPVQQVADAAPAPAGPAASAAPAVAERGLPLLVDDAADAGRGQIRKSEFLAVLRDEVSAAVDGALRGTGRDSEGCPWIDHWFGYYAERSSEEVERALRRYAPEAGGARDAQDYIRLVVGRVRRSAQVWAKTGEISGVPMDVPGDATAGGEVLGAVGGMFFKARPGGARPDDPVSVRRKLGGGQAMPGVLRTRMESAFGANFGGVRLHTGTRAATTSDQLNARAFTVGRDVAFGAGEFRPGTVAGDALIAHELAHVLQQGGAESASVQSKLPESTGQLEADADRSAVGVVAALWGPPKVGAAKVAPGLKSGLRLSRCSRDSKPLVMSPVTIAVKQPAKALNQRGSAEYKVQWSVGAGKNGWVLQHVKFGGAIQDAAGPATRNNSDLEYWEGWEVRSGSVYVGSSASAHQTDTFRTTTEPANTKGQIDITGKVAFVEGYGLSEPPWGHTVAAAMSLPTMTTAPTGWSDASAQDHTLTVNYDDIAKTPQTQVGSPP